MDTPGGASSQRTLRSPSAVGVGLTIPAKKAPSAAARSGNQKHPKASNLYLWGSHGDILKLESIGHTLSYCKFTKVVDWSDKLNQLAHFKT